MSRGVPPHWGAIVAASLCDTLRSVAYIPYIEECDASAELRELYARYRSPGGQVDNVLRIHSHNPASMEKHFELYATLMRGESDLSKIQREMIAIVVSAINECHY